MILALILRHRIPIALAVALLGLFAASWHYRSAYHAERALRVADRAAYAQAQAEAALIAKRALDAVEARYRSKANDADQSHTDALVEFARLADNYKSRNRLRSEAAPSASCSTTTSSKNHNPAIHTEPATSSIVVTEQDFDRCTAWVGYGEAVRDWAIQLNK